LSKGFQRRSIGAYGKNISKYFFSETTRTVETKRPRNDHWKESMSCGGGHLRFPIGIKNRYFVEDLPMIIPGQFGFNCPRGFREEALEPMGKIFQNISSLKPLGQLKPNGPGMIIGRSSTNCMFFMPIGYPRWPPPQYID
jgi:hypothetical protein